MPTWFQPFLYFFIGFHLRFDYYISWFRGTQENVKINDSEYYIKVFEHYSCIIIHNVIRFVLPYYFHPELGFYNILYLNIIEYVWGGAMFGIFSQISHILENVEWPIEKPVPKDWGTLQVLTAKDYSHDSFFWTYISGYLNYQVVHHLFPSVAPHYYPEISHIVKETCLEYNIQYDYKESFFTCLKSHWRHLLQFQKYRNPEFIKNREQKKIQ
jgi:fatty acid desaturase